jgi:transcriptional regulator with XRE-family HTH domain
MNRIKEIRKNNKITQTELAEKIGVTQAAVAKIEANTNNSLSVDMALKIAGALDTNIYELFGEEVDKPQNRNIKELEKELKRRQDYIKILKYNIEDTIKAYQNFENNEISITDIMKKLYYLISLLDVISKHDIP